MSDNRLTFEEVTELFGGTIPMEALAILANAPDDKTVEEVRDEITNLALKWNRRVPAPAVPDDVAKVLRDRIANLPRYEPDFCDGGFNCRSDMTEEPEGDWIKRDEVLALLDAHTAEQPAPALSLEEQEPVSDPMTVAEVKQWIGACNYEPAKQVLRDYLNMRAQPAPDAVAEARAICDDPEKLDAFMEAHPLPEQPDPVTADEVFQAMYSGETGICTPETWIDDAPGEDGDLVVDGYVNMPALTNWINSRIAKGTRP